MLDKIDSVKNNFLADIESSPLDYNRFIQLKSSYLGRKGKIAVLFSQLGTVEPEIRPKIGQALNKLKKDLTFLFDKKLKENQTNKDNPNDSIIDLTLPGITHRYGSTHVLEQTMQEIKDIFTSIGFHVAYGPEVDDEYHNFSALNIPEHHPSRDM